MYKALLFFLLVACVVIFHYTEAVPLANKKLLDKLDVLLKDLMQKHKVDPMTHIIA